MIKGSADETCRTSSNDHTKIDVHNGQNIQNTTDQQHTPPEPEPQHSTTSIIAFPVGGYFTFIVDDGY